MRSELMGERQSRREPLFGGRLSSAIENWVATFRSLRAGESDRGRSVPGRSALGLDDRQSCKSSCLEET